MLFWERKLDDKITCRTVPLITGIQTVLLSVAGPGLRDTATILQTLELGCVADCGLCQQTEISNLLTLLMLMLMVGIKYFLNKDFFP